MENTSGTDNTKIGENIAIGYDWLTHPSTGSNCTAIGYSALNGNTTGSNSTAIGQSAFLQTLGVSPLDSFLTTKTLSMPDSQFIVKYNPPDSNWKIFYKGVMRIATTISFINCSSESKLYEHDGKTIGCLLVIANTIFHANNNYTLSNMTTI